MTTFARPQPPAAPGRWMTVAEISRESGLRQDLVTRFVPGMDIPSGKLYSAHHVALARYVKELTDLNVPSAAVVLAVNDIESRPESEFNMLLTQSRRQQGRIRGRLWAGIGAAAASALLIGGIAGGLIGYSNGSSHSTAAPAPTTVTASAQPAQINPNIPVRPDPVCAEWAPLADSYASRQSAWGQRGGDPTTPANAWTPEQRDLNISIIPVLRKQAADMRRLADKAQDPLLQGLMRGQAVYEEAFAARLANYQPSDRPLWQAAIDFSGAVRAACTAVAPR